MPTATFVETVQLISDENRYLFQELYKLDEPIQVEILTDTPGRDVIMVETDHIVASCSKIDYNGHTLVHETSLFPADSQGNILGYWEIGSAAGVLDPTAALRNGGFDV